MVHVQFAYQRSFMAADSGFI